MTKQVLISMLRKGNTGNEILSILDTIDQPEEQTNVVEFAMPTLEEIDF